MGSVLVAGTECTGNVALLNSATHNVSPPEIQVPMADKNTLFCGDNLDILREHVITQSVDLVYLDPPFNSQQSFNVFFRDNSGRRSSSQRLAFEDTWEWGPAADQLYEESIKQGGSLAYILSSFRSYLKDSPMMAYLVMMAPRLQELKRVLKPTGSIYLHCDPTASHYIKVLMDGIFGQQNFRNEIIWKRTPFSGSSKARARQLPRNHDVILFYSASGERKWNAPSLPYTEKYLKRFKWEDDRGMYRKTLLKTYSQETFERLKTEDRLICPQREGAKYSYKQYLHESNGQRQIDDVWTDINMLNPVAKERRGYPTQKPLALLERIISASSDKGDVILDPFCGCGTSIDAAEKTGRRWIGIDITRLATAIIKQRLAENFGFQVFKKIRVIGEPVNIDEAVALAKEDKFGFQYWVVGKLGAPPIEHRRGADRGIDGRIYFYDGYGPAKEIIISVKAGEHINPAFVRELRGVIERERAEMGILVCVESPTKEMLLEAKRGGSYVGVAGTFPRLQIMTLADIFANKPLNIPGRINPYEKKRPASIASPEPEQLRLLP